MLRSWVHERSVDVWKFASGRPRQPPGLLDCRRLRWSPLTPAGQNSVTDFLLRWFGSPKSRYCR